MYRSKCDINLFINVKKNNARGWFTIPFYLNHLIYDFKDNWVKFPRTMFYFILLMSPQMEAWKSNHSNQQQSQMYATLYLLYIYCWKHCPFSTYDTIFLFSLKAYCNVFGQTRIWTHTVRPHELPNGVALFPSSYYDNLPMSSPCMTYKLGLSSTFTVLRHFVSFIPI